MPFFIIFIFIPFIEIMVFMAVGKHIGIFTTLLLAFLTAVIGGTLVKHQGLQTILAMRLSLDHGKIPLSEIFDGFCLVAAGALLITPGFVTDTIGFLLLIPAVRNALKTVIRNHTNWYVETESYNRTGTESFKAGPDVIEAEYEKLDETESQRD